MVRIIAISIFFILVSQVAIGNENIPTNRQMQFWWSKSHQEKIDFYDPIQIRKIYLTNKEQAYLAPVSVANRVRNEMLQTALVLPERGEVILLEGTIVKFVREVMDLDGDTVSEIIVEKSGSGQGTVSGWKAIVQISEKGEPIILRQVSFKNNEGAYGKKSQNYYMEEVVWKFGDIDGDGVKDLYETRIVQQGRGYMGPITKKGLVQYLFKDGEFVRYAK